MVLDKHQGTNWTYSGTTVSPAHKNFLQYHILTIHPILQQMLLLVEAKLSQLSLKYTVASRCKLRQNMNKIDSASITTYMIQLTMIRGASQHHQILQLIYITCTVQQRLHGLSRMVLTSAVPGALFFLLSIYLLLRQTRLQELLWNLHSWPKTDAFVP